MLTIHRSKGLEFPVVYCPYLWDPAWIPENEPPVFHDPAAGDRRTIDVGGKDGPGFDDHWRQHVAEERGEELRLAYVALTRARHQAVVWWASRSGSRSRPWPGCCSRPEDCRAVRGRRARTTSSTGSATLAAQAPGSISVERTTGGDGRRWTGTAGPTGPARGAAVRPDARRRVAADVVHRRSPRSSPSRTSTSEPEDTGITDEQLPIGPARPAPERADEVRCVRSAAAGGDAGRDPGRLAGPLGARACRLHGRRPRRRAGRPASTSSSAWSHVDIGPADVVVAGLQAAIETPLGPLAGEARLRDIGRGRPARRARLRAAAGRRRRADRRADACAALADVLDDHLAPGRPARRLRRAAPGPGARPAAAGLPHRQPRRRAAGAVPADGTPRFAVVDYKTNWLGATARS